MQSLMNNRRSFHNRGHPPQTRPRSHSTHIRIPVRHSHRGPPILLVPGPWRMLLAPRTLILDFTMTHTRYGRSIQQRTRLTKNSVTIKCGHAERRTVVLRSSRGIRSTSELFKRCKRFFGISTKKVPRDASQKTCRGSNSRTMVLQLALSTPTVCYV